MVTKVTGRHRKNADATRAAVLEAAERLFQVHGFDRVTMRQIAAQADCSHTVIYRYFSDKEALFEALAVPMLEELDRRIALLIAPHGARDGEGELGSEAGNRVQRLVDVGLAFVRFGLENRSMFRLYFIVRAGRVDGGSPDQRVDKLRIGLFNKLRDTVTETLGPRAGEEQRLACARGMYYLLHGMIGTYEHSAESADALMSRLTATYEYAIRALITGYQIGAIHTGATE